MGQIEVYEYLKQQRLSGNHDFFSVIDVVKALKEQGKTNGMLESVRGSLMMLRRYGYLENKMSGDIRDWKMLFRLKEEYLKIEEVA